MVQSKSFDSSLTLALQVRILFFKKNSYIVVDCTDLKEESDDPDDLPEYSERSNTFPGSAETKPKDAKHRTPYDK